MGSLSDTDNDGKVEIDGVEGVWVPTTVVEAWPKLRQQIDGFLQSLESAESQAALKQTEAFLDTLLADLERIQATEDGRELGNELQKIGTRYQKEMKSLFGKLGKSGKLRLPW